MSIVNRFIEELRRRSVLRVAIAYAAAAWLLVQVVETLFPVYGLSDAAVRTVVTLLAILFPVVLILAWLYEFTPDGLKLDRDVDRDKIVARRHSKGIDRAIILVLTLALGFFAIDKFVLGPERVVAYGDSSIAVLPFENMSADPGDEYFSDGISEELLNLLARVQGLRVVSRTSSFAFKGQSISISEVAKRLNVRYVLEGSVRRFDNQLRITAQLIDADSDTHLWSDTYDRRVEDLFKVQDDIASKIVTALGDALGLGQATTPTVSRSANPQAHDAYLLGRYLVSRRTTSDMQAAIVQFEKAIELDPDFALAHAELGLAYALGYLPMSSEEAAARATPHVTRALTLDPGLAEAHAAAGMLVHGRNVEEALRHYKRAVEINPNYADPYTWMAHLLDGGLGQYEETFEAREKAVSLDPLSIAAISNYVDGLFEREKYEEARRQLEKLAQLAPGIATYQNGFGRSIGGQWAEIAVGALEGWQLGRQDLGRELAEAFALLGMNQESLRLTPGLRPYDGLSLLLGLHDQAVETAKARFDQRPDAPGRIAHLGLSLAAAGKLTEALPYLEKLWEFSGERVTGWYRSEGAAALAMARRAQNEAADIAELVDAINDNVSRMRVAGITAVDWAMSADYEAGLAAYLAGDTKRAIELIGSAVERGYFLPSNANYLPGLHADPGFAPIVEAHQARQASERQRFLDAVCVDNPYADVWQPLDETCAGYP